jgi:Protein of unknown function (DUF2946)
MTWPSPDLHSRAPQRSLAAWLTLLAMAMVFMAPAVSRTLAFAQGQSLIACPMHMALSMPSGPDAPSSSALVSVDACPLCVLAGGLPLPEPVAAAAQVARVDRVAQPRQAGALPQGPLRWQPPPRGPPSLA